MIVRAARARGWSTACALPILCAGVAAWAQPARGGDPAPARSVSIEGAFHLARAASESIAAAGASLESARFRVRSAASAWLPQIDAGASYQRTILSEFDDLFDPTSPGGVPLDELPFGQKNVWRLGLNGSQIVWSGGRIASSVRAAEAGVTGAHAQLDSVRAQVVLDTAQAYYDAALAGRLVEVAEATLAQTEEALRHASLAFSQGRVAELDVLRAEVARDSERTNVINAVSRRRVAEARLRRLLGVADGTPMVLTSRLDADDLEVVDAAAQRQAGTGPGAGRAPVREATAFVDARLADLGLARAELFPSLSLTSRLEVVDYPPDVWFDRDADRWRTNFSVMVVASYPVFTGFRRTADIRAARARVTASRTRLAETVELARLADLEADEEVGRARAVLAQSQRTVEQGARAYDAAQARYENGVATHLDLVDARVVLQRARVDQARAARDLRVARVRRAVLPGLPVTFPTTLVITTESDGAGTTAPP